VNRPEKLCIVSH